MVEKTTEDGKLPIMMLHDRVLVKVSTEDGDRRSAGGILIPATAQVAKRLLWGTVLAAGPNARNVKVDDRVLFAPEDQHEVEIHAETYILLRERDIHAIAAERVEVSTGLYL
ncbi:chaperonin GroES [Antricoccus suffuscus]|uniref:10 kDa chaperonin n=1 Tax=Antricoccus suffuscus TaxID=1629062 RepID=A0A2T1A2Y8_9ACTN|nr:co-chaperone GroES [Antricoccus suffuscus]PRZ42963.1 chaperonin GroES [Antricoccus suffuscus]